MTSVTADQLQAFLQSARLRCDAAMSNHLSMLTAMPAQLADAMRYSTLLGGKRIRPCLVYASAYALGGNSDNADTAACAVEFMHCYSLIHDDLPAMDNDDLRRGKPTLHKAFDEATAILAGDALQSLAFQILSEATHIEPGLRLQMVASLAKAGGCDGMIAGQSIDMAAVGQALTLAELEYMHRLKTGALISASVELGALSAGNNEVATQQILQRYAACIGLAFQVQDDILDVISDTATLGKTQGADQARNKPTYVSLLGLDGARHKAATLVEQACDELQALDGEIATLEAIARYITARQH